jgi:hypothetical protein
MPVIEIAVATIGGIFLLLGKRVDNHMKRREKIADADSKAKAIERREEQTFRRTIEVKHTRLFEAFIEEQRKAAAAFEGIHSSVSRIGDEIKEMKDENRDYRNNIFSRIEDLEKKTSLHDGLLAKGSYKSDQ